MPDAGIRFRIAGRVHGVGFRPFVWRLARDLALAGQVRNDGAGVEIEAWGKPEALDAFAARLLSDAPPLARIDAITRTGLGSSPTPSGFRIVASAQGPVSTEIAPDVATCPACLAETGDPADRHHRYAFTNCTQCGPRLSIVTGIPYDRPKTSMAGFAMCPDCAAEFDDPSNRRFHAQPISCPACGPRVWLEDARGPVRCADPIAETARRLAAGGIAAVKGVGGFHLACDATRPEAVAELRRRKRRPAKPFAVMAPGLDAVRLICRVGDAEEAALASPPAPIVLLEKRGDPLPGVAPDLSRLGVMLPYSPLHHMLLAELGRPVVLTSGNLSSAPPVTGNEAARADLAGIADVWLMHDREIVARLDDSVVRADPAAPTVLRRARGFAPGPVNLSERFRSAPRVLAMGGDLKAAFCFLDGRKATPSPHIGDLNDARVFADYRRQIGHFRSLYGFDPDLIAVDAHRDYLSARWGRALAAETGAGLVTVQHHHAHLASCLAENGVPQDDDGTVGIILDGAGSGPDGTVWGGEVLLGGYRDARRVAHLPPVPLPGGDLCARDPWRNTVAHLIAAFGTDWRAMLAGTGLARLADDPSARAAEEMIRKGVNAPLSSSAGRLFDAVAAAIGFGERQSYEGQAAMKLEALATPHMTGAGAYDVPVTRIGDSFVPDWAPLWAALLSDLRNGEGRGPIAARFHRALITALSDIARRVVGDHAARRYALSGGVMQNRILSDGLQGALRSEGHQILIQREVPCNDGGLALGQAAVAASRAAADR